MRVANFTFQPLYPQEKKNLYPFVIGGWVGATADLEVLEQREISQTYWHYESRNLVDEEAIARAGLQSHRRP
jgi:hypothetical protein